MKIGVIGCGNVGYNWLKVLKLKGFEVLGYDISENVRQQIILNTGSKCLATDFSEMAICDIVFECVPTDQKNDSEECDLSIVESVVTKMASLENNLDYRCKVFVQRSTCPPGTAKKYSKFLKKTNYAVNPNFIRNNKQWEDTINPERIAIAGNKEAIELLKSVYKSFSAPLLILDNYEAIELLKYFENITDAVLISLWNEFLTISDDLNIPRYILIELIDSFVEREKFRTAIRIPGQAFGLQCLPKDLNALIYEFIDKQLSVIQAASKTNEIMKNR